MVRTIDVNLCMCGYMYVRTLTTTFTSISVQQHARKHRQLPTQHQSVQLLDDAQMDSVYSTIVKTLSIEPVGCQRAA